LQADVAAELAQQQQQAQQMQRTMQADIDALHAALADTETQRDAAIGRASLMKEQVTDVDASGSVFETALQALASHDYVRRAVDAVAPVLQQGQVQEKMLSARTVPATDEALLQR
jgi:Skp family chaperone for outer membrane proteins